MKKFKTAFTTSEVLFTLLILGVIAALTIIVLSQETSGRDRILRVKKAYSVVANSYDQVRVDYGAVNVWDTFDSGSIADKIGKRLNLKKSCGTANLQRGNECFPDCPKIYKADGGSLEVCTSSNVATMMTNDGFAYAFQIEDPSCTIDVTGSNVSASLDLKQICGTFLLDIDSSTTSRNRNFYGRDLFLFYISREGLFPTGLDIDSRYPKLANECKQQVLKDEFGCSALMVYGDGKLEK